MEIGNDGIPLDIFVCQFVNLNFEIIKMDISNTSSDILSSYSNVVQQGSRSLPSSPPT